VSGISKIIKSIEPGDELDEDPPTIELRKDKSLEIPPAETQKPPYQSEQPLEPLNTAPTSSEPEIDYGWTKTVTIIGFVIWIIASLIIAISVLKIGQNWQNYTALQWAGLVTLFVGPAIMLGLGGYALAQLAKISSRAQSLEKMIHSFSQPDRLAAEKSASLTYVISQQIDFVNAKLNEALGRTSAIEGVLKTQATSIYDANQAAKNASQSIGQTLEAQKNALLDISKTFDDRMVSLSALISSHSEELAKATLIADQKIKEAQINVEGATSKINSASEAVRVNSAKAASTLSASHDEISSLGDIIHQRSLELDDVYKRHANELTSMIEHLRNEQQNLGENLEDTLGKMKDLASNAQASANSLSSASNAGKQTIEALAKSASLADDAVKTRFAEMEQMVRYSSDHAQNISDLASQRVQDSLEHSRTEIARIERDMASLQDKLAHTASTTTIDLVSEEDKAITKAKRRSKRSRIQLTPLKDERAVVEASEAQKEVEIKKDMVKSATSNVEDKIETENILDLHFEEPTYEDLESGSLDSDPIIAAIRPVAEYDSARKGKPAFSFRGLFNRGSSQTEKSSLDIVSQAPDTQQTDTGSLDEEFTTILSDIGLGPNVIVDDGCVIEAANNRAASGHEAMSRCVIARLKDPVRHFSNALSADPEFSQRAIDFATQYDRTIEQLAGDREAIRTKLESENGRAYLLSDAALNYGRV